jgi:hypothetical protein
MSQPSSGIAHRPTMGGSRMGWRRAGVPAPGDAAPAVDSVTMMGLTAMVGVCIFLQRFALPVGATQLPAAFVAGYLIFLGLLFRGRLTVHTTLLALFLTAMACMTLALIVSAETASVSSFFYVLSIYVLYIFRLKYPAGSFGRVIDIFLNMMAVCAACGIAQFALQFVLGADAVFPFDTYLPDPVLLDGYNVIIPLEYASGIMKSNGVFFLEPSFFSQFLALAVLVETLRAQRLSRLALYAAAMIVSYSGTGIILLALFLPGVLLKRGNTALLGAGFVLVLILGMVGGALDLDMLTNRIGEFSSTESSGFARFISPYYLIRDFLVDTPSDLIFGLGPGAIERIETEASSRAYLAHDPSWIKLILEYGLISAMVFLAFISTALFQGSRNRTLSWAVMFLYLFLGGYFLNGFMHCLFASMLAWHSRSVSSGVPVRVRPQRPAWMRGPRGFAQRPVRKPRPMAAGS